MGKSKRILETKENFELKETGKRKNKVKRLVYDIHHKTFPQTYEDQHFYSPLVESGYGSLSPTYHPKTLERRQKIIETFVKDYKSNKSLLKHLQMMHLATSVGQERKNAHTALKTSTWALKALYDESKLFLKELEKSHPKIAISYYSTIPHNAINTTIEAGEAGKFNFLFFPSKSERTLLGSMDHPREFNEEIKSVTQVKSEEKSNLNKAILEKSIDNEYWTLNFNLGIFGALYSEALVQIHREKNNLPFCFPEINYQQRFELKNAEPLIEVVGQPISSSIKSKGDKARTILSGLHSGGKTIMLQNIPHYVIGGLSGRVLPAEKATIPLLEEIVYSLEAEEKGYRRESGKLKRELWDRLSQIRKLNKKTLYVGDEFLQHASPDAAEYLEPTILKDIEATGTAAIIVTHRGDFIDESVWDYKHPNFTFKDKKITPNYQFSNGKPDENAMKQHAMQLLEKIKNGDLKTTEKREKRERYHEQMERINKGKERAKELREILKSRRYFGWDS